MLQALAWLHQGHYKQATIHHDNMAVGAAAHAAAKASVATAHVNSHSRTRVLLAALRGRLLQFQHVKAHFGHPWNDLADLAAKAGALGQVLGEPSPLITEALLRADPVVAQWLWVACSTGPQRAFVGLPNVPGLVLHIPRPVEASLPTVEAILKAGASPANLMFSSCTSHMHGTMKERRPYDGLSGCGKLSPHAGPGSRRWYCLMPTATSAKPPPTQPAARTSLLLSRNRRGKRFLRCCSDLKSVSPLLSVTCILARMSLTADPWPQMAGESITRQFPRTGETR